MLGVSPAALAQQPAFEQIVITARRPLPDIAPERIFDRDAVEAYGLDNIGEVVREVAAENGERGDDIVFLVNGERVSGLSEVEDLPAEAIASLEVLPMGSGARVGASPRQRIYSIRLRRKLDLATASARLGTATRGGWSSRHGEVGFTHLRGQRRVNATARLRDESMLLESEREVVQPATALPGAASFRSLAPATDRLELSLSAADRLAPWLSGSFVSRFSLSDRHALQGAFAPAGIALEPLDQRGQTLTAATDLTFNAQAGRWSFNLTGNLGLYRSRNRTDRAIGTAVPLLSSTQALTRSVGGSLTAYGSLVDLPAGPLLLTLAARASRDSIRSERDFQGFSRDATSQSQSELRAGIEVPIASDSTVGLGFLGDLSLDAEIIRRHVSDFGSLRERSLSLFWNPVRGLDFSATFARSDSAPPIASLDEPLLATPGIRYFDPLRGETVDLTFVTGGVPGLPPESERTRRFLARFAPVRSLALQFTSEYFESRIANSISALPPASLSVQQAFPDRFGRDSEGRLVLVDARPVAFAARDQRRLRTGLTLSLPLGEARPGGDESGDDASLPAADRGLDQPEVDDQGTRSRFGIRPRLQLSLAHSWLLESKLVLRAGQAPIDLLSREAVGLGGLGQPRHRIDAALGYAGRGIGARLSTQFRGESFIEASGASNNVLRFEPLATFGMRAWIQGERIDRASTLLKGSRLTLSVANLANTRERVTDRFGATPLSYQPDYRDPIARTVEIELRKKF